MSMNPPEPGPVTGLSATQETSAAADCCVDGVAARFEHARACFGREPMTGGDCPSHGLRVARSDCAYASAAASSGDMRAAALELIVEPVVAERRTHGLGRRFHLRVLEVVAHRPELVV